MQEVIKPSIKLILNALQNILIMNGVILQRNNIYDADYDDNDDYAKQNKKDTR